jgi:TetR/AcrR family transcriptional repressor of nem operon
MQTTQKGTTKIDRTRSFIVERSAGLFNKKGYSGTSMADVQVATGLSRGGLYGCFENKEMIALAVFDYNLSKICDIISTETKNARSFHDRLLAFANVYKMIGNNSIFIGGSPLLNTASEADDTDGLLRDRVSKALIKKEKGIAAIIESGISAGEFKKTVNPTALAHTMISFLEGGLMIARATNDFKKLDEMVSTMDNMIFQIRN